MNKYQKGFAPIIIALIVLVLAGAGGTSYYLINKQSKLLNNNVDTSNWKMYTNSAAGFEIKYPSNWESPFENWGPSFTAGISIDNNNYCVVDAMGWLGSNDAEIADLIGKGYVKTSIKIDGIDAIRLTRNPTGAGLTEAIYFEVNDKSFRIGRNRGSGDKIEQDCIKNFNQIITTFNFIDEIVSWKTYTNNKYNYQINYPENIYTIENITSNPEKGMTDDNVTLYDIKSVQKTKECECGEYMAIYINTYSNPQGLPLQNYIEKNIKHWASDYSNLFINEQTSLNGIPAIKIGTEREQYYVLEKNNIIFSIGGFIDMNIINTFKFTDEETVNNEIADWKTYTNSNIGFEFKYPTDLIKDTEWENSVRLNGSNFYVIFGSSDIDKHCSAYPMTISSQKFENGNISFDKVVSKGRMADAKLSYVVQYYTIKTGKCFYFEFLKDFGSNSWYSEEKFPDSLLPYKTFDAIVSTFKFVD